MSNRQLEIRLWIPTNRLDWRFWFEMHMKQLLEISENYEAFAG